MSPPWGIFLASRMFVVRFPLLTKSVSHRAYSSLEDFATTTGIAYLRHWNIDFVGGGQEAGVVLPTDNKTLSPKELKEWMSSAKAREYFKATSTYALLKSQAIRKAGSQLMLFLRDRKCIPYCVSVECYDNLTPRPLNGTSKEHQFDWWATLITGFYRFCAETDPNSNLIHIWNEPNTVCHHYLYVYCMLSNLFLVFLP